MVFKQHKFLIFVGISILVILIVVFWSSTASKVYETSVVTKGSAVEAIYATAVVEPVTWSAISPIKTGRIVKVNVDEGDPVKSGDVLARLDDSDLRAQITESKALEDYYDAELHRAEKLLPAGGVSRKVYDQSKSNLAQIRARISMYEEQIRQLALAAPIDGIVLWRDVELGEVKEAGKPLFWVGQPRPLRLEAEIDEEDIPKIKSGQRVLITADAFPSEAMEGIVHWISPKGDPVNKSYRAYITLPNNTKLMIGMTVETNTIVQDKGDAILTVPEAIVGDSEIWTVQQNNGSYVAQKKMVQLGIRGKNQIEIIEGLHAGDLIILPPFDDLKAGMKIRIE